MIKEKRKRNNNNKRIVIIFYEFVQYVGFQKIEVL